MSLLKDDPSGLLYRLTDAESVELQRKRRSAAGLFAPEHDSARCSCAAYRRAQGESSSTLPRQRADVKQPPSADTYAQPRLCSKKWGKINSARFFLGGPQAVRAYWTEQWSEIDPHMEPVTAELLRIDHRGGHGTCRERADAAEAGEALRRGTLCRVNHSNYFTAGGLPWR